MSPSSPAAPPRLTARDRLISTLQELPGPTARIGRKDLTTLVDAVARSPKSQGVLRRYVLDRPGFTTDADPYMPRLAQQLLRVMQDAGIEGIILPRCMACNEPRFLVQTMRNGQRACFPCTRKQYIRPCGICSESRQISRVRNGVDYCQRCWRKDPASFKECSGCGRYGIIEKRSPQGLLCPRCAPGTIAACHSCAKTSPIRGYLLGGPQCEPCHHRIRRIPAACPHCHGNKIIAYLDSTGTPCCASCAGVPPRRTCADCGTEENIYGRRCCSCEVRERSLDLITDNQGVLNTVFEPVRQQLLASSRSASIAHWIRRSASARLIRRFVNNELALGHAALDGCPRTSATDYVRSLFITAGLLAHRDENLHRFEAWTAAFLGSLSQQTRTYLEPYLRWIIGRQLRLQARTGPIKDSTLSQARQKGQTAAGFMQHVVGRGLEPAQASQSALDDYVTENPRSKPLLAAFLTWAAANTDMPKLRIHVPRPAYPASTMSEKEYWDTVNRLQTDRNIPLHIRISGLFIGLYAQTLTSITTLTLDDFTIDDQQVSIHFGRSPVRTHDALAALIAEHQQVARPWATDETARWLFPARQPGRHISSSALSAGLSKCSIKATPLRNAGLINLAAHIPIAPLCDLTGLGPMAAARWADVAARSWNSYPELRSESGSEEAYGPVIRAPLGTAPGIKSTGQHQRVP
ncbi:hypothetical protein [Paenarthrobacter ureafaciens]|uniref:hypothetical protein n=1 Tax=Paenarthrobacter ureafaciens TaxID=37931 RepID=UPI00226F95ED|nr:hypothetical protein [Paenarthrobacter ureafaciens]MCY0975554.1 hypothetical protein [Paenarthrobacter ureafaciens]